MTSKRQGRRTAGKTKVTDLPGMALTKHGGLDKQSMRSMSQASKGMLQLVNETGFRETRKGAINQKRAQKTRVEPLAPVTLADRVSRGKFTPSQPDARVTGAVRSLNRQRQDLRSRGSGRKRSVASALSRSQFNRRKADPTVDVSGFFGL